MTDNELTELLRKAQRDQDEARKAVEATSDKVKQEGSE